MLITAIQEKKCEKCNEIKDANEFYRNGRTFTTICKSCIKASRKQMADKKHKSTKRVSILHKLCVEMVRNAKKRAIYTKKEFDIDVDFIEQLVTEFSKENKCDITLKKEPFKPSIDRIDNNKGYTKDNIKICWLIENYCKNTFTDDDVIEFCKRKLNIYE